MLRVVSRAFYALCVYSMFGHHPHPLGLLCAKFRFVRGLHFWASPWRKIAYSITQSITHLAYLKPGNRSFCFGTCWWALYCHKLESVGNPPVYTASSYVHTFWHNTSVWRTDGIAIAKTAPSRAARCKMGEILTRKNPFLSHVFHPLPSARY